MNCQIRMNFQIRTNRQILNMFLTLVCTLALVGTAAAQPCPAGSASNGSDGPYSPTASGDFDPTALGLNPAGDNVFNFTTINIPAGVTIRLRATKVRNASVIWLACGNVTIAGTLNLNGDSGYLLDASNVAQIIQNRREAEPGAGGYYGGLGANGGVGPEAGAGPGGGPAGLNVSNNNCNGGFAAGYSVPSYPGGGVLFGQSYGNLYLVPLYGGSGGGGGWGSNANGVGGGGGGGGGALRIFSPTQISVTGSITANGGSVGAVNNQPGYCGGGSGSGGAIHLIAPTITGNGSLTAYQGGWCGDQLPCYGGVSNSGFIRFNTSTNNFTGTMYGQAYQANGNYYSFVGPFYNVPTNSTLSLPTVTMVSITTPSGTVNVPANPQAQYLNPDLQINASTPVTVNIATTNIPLSTTVMLRVTSESAGDQLVSCATPINGSVASGTTTCTATFPFSISIASLRATW